MDTVAANPNDLAAAAADLVDNNLLILSDDSDDSNDSDDSMAEDAMIAEHEQITQLSNAGDAAGAAARWEVLLTEARTMGHEEAVGIFVGSLRNAYDELGQPYEPPGSVIHDLRTVQIIQHEVDDSTTYRLSPQFFMCDACGMGWSEDLPGEETCHCWCSECDDLMRDCQYKCAFYAQCGPSLHILPVRNYAE
jgi:hypothetical protein